MTGRDHLRQQPRILHVIDNLAIGGAELGLLELVNGARRHFAPVICCIRDLGPDARRYRAAGAEVIFLAKREGPDWRIPWRIAALCRRLRPSIVHTHNWGSIEGVGAAWLARVPAIVHTEHGRDSTVSDRAGRRRNRARRVLLPLADRVVAVSEHLGERLRLDAGLSPPKLLTIPNGVDCRRFVRPPDCHRSLRAAWGFTDEEIVVGAVGRLQAIKGYRGLIEAFAALAAREPRARLVIVGDGDERAAIEAAIAARRLEHLVTLTGTRSDVPECLWSFDIFVQPSLHEGLSHSVLEAMVAELPIVATRIPGNQELVDDGVNGALCTPDDAEDLAAAIARYCGDPGLRREHGRVGHRRAQSYGSQHTVAAYLALYGQLLGSSAACAE